MQPQPPPVPIPRNNREPARSGRTRKSPTLYARCSAAGGVPVTQSLKSEICPIAGQPLGVRAAHRLCGYEATSQTTGSSIGATRQAKIDQHFQELTLS